MMHRLIGVGLLILLVFAPNLLANDNISANLLSRIAVVAAVVLLVFLAESEPRRKERFWGLWALLFASFIAYTALHLDWMAWALAISWFSALILLGRQLTPPRKGVLSAVRAVALWLGLAAIAGGALALIYALSINFAEEEFFVAVTGLVVSLFWLTLAMAYQVAFPRPTPLFASLRRPRMAGSAVVLVLILLTIFLIPWTLKQYQRSFFPLIAPAYHDISEDKPFLCETIISPPQPLPAKQIKDNLLALLDAAPQKNTLIWGSLARYTGDAAYAAEFRRSLLQEAAEARYTSPAHSVKWGQYEAALRAHQLALISRDFPTLFSAEDWQTLNAWFAEINRRTMTVEWVDWLYAAAYGKVPEGPYENQEIGAGLLAVLMQNNWAAADLIEQNRAYLDSVPLGWRDIFRNTDDSYSYQGVWLPNAWWIYNYRQAPNNVTRRNIAQSFQWLLLQALPNGETLTYNTHGEPPSLTAYLFGAALLNNPELSWLAGKNARLLLERGQYLRGGFTVPDFDFPDGQAPDIGSCLMYGNSGVPTKKGVLGPDKIVLRDGWADDAMVALLNLRFTGWHRYKATNTMPLLYSDGALVSERGAAEDFWWLPVGRSAFRDKRIPREYLNGLLLPKSGLSAVLWRLTGVGSKWAQNPPAYAEVDVFFASDSVDVAQTTLPNWNGWRHTRTSYLVHDGMTVVIDHAETDRASKPASVIWHLNGSGIRKKNSLRLDNAHRPAKMVWIEGDDAHISLEALPSDSSFLRSPDWELLYTSPIQNHLDFATVFLAGDHAAGELSSHRIDETQGISVHYMDDQVEITMLHNNSDAYLQDDDLGTDGAAALLIEDQAGKRVCIVDGQRVSVKRSNFPKQILTEAGEAVSSNVSWIFDGERLEIELNNLSSGCFEIQ